LNRTLLQAQLMYNDMGKSEKKVADWLFSHSGEILPYSISDLASKCDSSEATIVRFSKRLGCSGYQELKITLAKEHDKKVIQPTITGADDCFSIFEKVCNDAYMSLERTKKTLSAEAMTRAAEAISSARRVVLIGLGTSAQVAEDASNKLLIKECEDFILNMTVIDLHFLILNLTLRYKNRVIYDFVALQLSNSVIKDFVIFEHIVVPVMIVNAVIIAELNIILHIRSVLETYDVVKRRTAFNSSESVIRGRTGIVDGLACIIDIAVKNKSSERYRIRSISVMA